MQANFNLVSEMRGVRRLSDFFVDALIAAGCSHVFALPAESLNPILDAVRKNGRIQLVTVRHEGVGGLMASALAKLTGRLAVCMGTAGPGASHLPPAAYDARCDGAPLLVVSGQVWLRLMGTSGFQEIDSVGLHADAADASRLIGSTEQTEALLVLLAHAVSRSTAVHVAIPADVASAVVQARSAVRIRGDWLRPRVAVSPSGLAAATAVLAGRAGSALLIGAVKEPAVQHALEAMAERLNAPLFVLPEGIDVFRSAARWPVIRLTADAEDAWALLRRADRVVAVGRTSPGLTKALRSLTAAALVHLAPASDRWMVRPHDGVRVFGEATSFLDALGSAVDQGDRAYFSEATGLPPAAETALPREVWAALDRALPATATVSLEPGMVLDSAFRHFAVGERRVTSSFGYCVPGYALPGAIAGGFARPGAPSVAIATPRGLSEAMADMLTASKYQLPVRVLCLRDRAPGNPAIDFAAFAASAGFRVHRSIAPEALEGALRSDLDARGPCLIDLDLAPRQTTALTLAAEEQRAEPPAGERRALDVLLETLAEAGVSHLYCTEQAPLLPMINLAAGAQPVEVVTTVLAESAAMMASAHAKWTGVLGVCLAADSVEAAAMLNGLYDASFDRAPVLVIAPPGDGVADAAALFKELAPLREYATPRTLGDTVLRAAEEAYRGRTVSLVQFDWARLDDASDPPRRRFQSFDDGDALIPPHSCLEEAARTLSLARRPAILVGRGAHAAREEVLELARRFGAPVVATMPGRGVLADDDPQYAGCIGASGHASAHATLGGCDVLVSVGCSTRGSVYGLAGAFKLIQLDSDPLQLGRRPYATIGLHGSARPTLRALLDALTQGGGNGVRALSGPHPNGRNGTSRLRERFEGFVDQSRTALSAPRKPIRPAAICVALQAVLAELPRPAAITVDVGVTTLWVYRHLTQERHRIVWTSSFATMGFALPAAIAIAGLEPDRPVVAIAGDGGIGITMAELASAARRALPLVVIVFNNGKLAAIKYEQEVMGWPEFEAGLCNPNFAEYARSCGVAGTRVEEQADLADALRSALTRRGPSLVEVICDPHDLPSPPRVHPRQMAGYVLASVREGAPGVREMLRQAAHYASDIRKGLRL